MSAIEITPDMTMEQILAAAPSAQRALFQRYHVGGCSSCGFQPTDTLAQVCKERNLLDVAEVIRTIQRAEELDGRVQVAPEEVKGWIDAGQDFSFIDVRMPREREEGRFEPAEPLDFENQAKYMELPKERRMVFACGDGERSLDVASYFIGHGFTQVFALRGGIRAWAQTDGSPR